MYKLQSIGVTSHQLHSCNIPGNVFEIPSNILNLDMYMQWWCVFYSQNVLYPLSLFISFFCFHGFRLLSHLQRFKNGENPTSGEVLVTWRFIDFPEDLCVQRGLIGRYHPNYLAIGWTRRAKKRTFETEPLKNMMELRVQFGGKERSLSNWICKQRLPKGDLFVCPTVDGWSPHLGFLKPFK